MLSKKDLLEIRKIIKEEMTIRDITVERTNRDTGAKELKTIDLYLPEWIACELPNLAAALRGVQETADHAKNNSYKTMAAFGCLAQNIEESVKQLKFDEAKVLKIESST